MKRNERTFILLTLPGLILYSLFYVFPALSGIFYSFTNWNGLDRTFKFIGARNYVKVLRDSRALNSFIFNLRYSAMLVVSVLLLSTLLALLLDSRIRLRKVFKSIYFFPAVLSLITVGLVWEQIFYYVMPEIGKALGIPLLTQSILSTGKTAIFGVLIVNLWQGLAVPTVLLLAGLQAIPQELREAAAIDGSSGARTFFHITFPYLVPIYNLVFVLALRDGLTVFDYILAMTQGGPGRATESLGLLIFNHAFREMKFSYAVTESVLLALVFSLISLAQMRLLDAKGASV